ncbi:MAG: DUF2510 domain-containing protein [Mycobacterium sp.]
MTSKRAVVWPSFAAKLTMAAESTADRTRCAKRNAAFAVANAITPTPKPQLAPVASPPGWYPDPSGGVQRYWYGANRTAAAATPDPGGSNKAKQAAVAAGVCILVAIGFVMSMQSVSLMTGSGIVWTGVAIVGGGMAASFFLGAQIWVRVLAGILLVIALINALSIEHQMSKKREELTRIFNR